MKTAGFELASVSKQFTATAIMQLANRGKLSYQDPLTKYIPELPFEKVTIENLLRHTSGIPEFLGFDEKWFDKTKINKNGDLLNVLKTHIDTLLFPPNERSYYSNTNYILLALIVEKVSELSFEKYIDRNVFSPSEMKNSMVISGRSLKNPFQNYAIGMAYDPSKNGFVSVDEFPSYNFLTYFDGIGGPYGISSTVKDLYAWDQAISKETVLRNKEFQESISTGKLNNDSLTVGMMDSYSGFGWMFMDKTENEKMHFHSGGLPGYQTLIVRDPSKKQFVALLLNKMNLIGVMPIMAAVDKILKNDNPPKVSIEEFGKGVVLMDCQINPLIGTYAFNQDKNLKYHITVNDEGKLFARLTGQPAAKVYATSELELFYTIVDATIKFQKQDDEIHSLTLFQNGMELVFEKEK
jgi:CubicO group peptidase (beta-lactamase class C family)